MPSLNALSGPKTLYDVGGQSSNLDYVQQSTLFLLSPAQARSYMRVGASLNAGVDTLQRYIDEEAH